MVSKSYRLGVMARERIVVIELGADLLRDAVVREETPAYETVGLVVIPLDDWEECDQPAEYIPPKMAN